MTTRSTRARQHSGHWPGVPWQFGSRPGSDGRRPQHGRPLQSSRPLQSRRPLRRRLLQNSRPLQGGR
eukprot:11226848-Lingulodinium_polyedra.AAC.1